MEKNVFYTCKLYVLTGMLAQHTRGNLCVQLYIQKGCGLWTLSCDCPSFPTETLKWLSSLPILMQESFWWWQCSDGYNLPPSSPTSIPSSLFSPSLISVMVSVDVKHHVYLLTTSILPSPISPSLINLMVSVDVKHHVYLLTFRICALCRVRELHVWSIFITFHAIRAATHYLGRNMFHFWRVDAVLQWGCYCWS